jgi:mRNA interferase HigB
MNVKETTLRIIKIRTLQAHFIRYPDVRGALTQWIEDVEHADWGSPQDIKNDDASASILPGNRVVFNIRGNHYRLITFIFYPARIVYIKFFGTHAEYDRVDALTVDDY